MASLNELKANALKTNPYLKFDGPGYEASMFIIKVLLLTDLTHEKIAEATSIDIDKVKRIQAGAISIDDADFQTVYAYCFGVYNDG